MVACVAYALVNATRAKELYILTTYVIPAAERISWEASRGEAIFRDAVAAIATWREIGLGDSSVNVLTKMSAPAPKNFFGGHHSGVCAFELASFFANIDIKSGAIHNEVAAAASLAGLPTDPSNHNPREFLTLCSKAPYVPASQYLASSTRRLHLLSRAGSMKQTAAALRAWGEFCKVCRVQPFPVAAGVAASFASIFREPLTYSQYLSHIKAACEYLGAPTDWAWAREVACVKLGLKKAGFTTKGPKLAVSGNLITAITGQIKGCRAERFYCALSWVFLLRARSEASILRRAESSAELNPFEPIAHEGVIGRVGDEVVIRLRGRKNKIGGETISRACVCRGGEGVPLNAPPPLCPTHSLWGWVSENVAPGGRLFHERINGDAATWLKIALRARSVEHADRYTLHALRRGGAQELCAKGAPLATILQAGGWRSSAFAAYLSSEGLEKQAMAATLTNLLDFDEEE